MQCKGSEEHRAVKRSFLVAFCWLLLSTVAVAQSPGLSALLRDGQDALDSSDFARAARDFEQAQQLTPDNLDASRGLLLSYLQLGRLEQAEQVGHSAVARWPDNAELQHWLGLVYFKKSQNGDALAALRRSASLNSHRYDVYFDTALVLLSMSNYHEAADELEKAIKLDPKAALAHVLLGRAYQNTNRTVQAIEQFQTGLRLDPNVPLGHYHLGFAFASLGRSSEAISEYEKELQHSSDNFQVLYQLGHQQLETGDLQSAVAHLTKATEVDSNSADAFYDLGKGILLRGDAAGAMYPLRRAIELKPSDPSPHYQLARALEKTGGKEEAKREFETFTTLKKAQPVTGGMASGQVP